MTRANGYGAFCTHPHPVIEAPQAGPLAGTTFAAKDCFDVVGWAGCAGHPAWLASHPPAEATAPAVQRLLDAGSSLAGKTQLDELMYGTNGQNRHYGTPVNPRAPDRVPGGSSSGSAVAVAAGLVDIALGTDSACSVRVPASHCSVAGIRPTHGRVSVSGVVPLSPSLDTVGWFARDGRLLRDAGRALLDGWHAPPAPVRLIVALDAFELAQPRTGDALRAAVPAVAACFDTVVEQPVLADGEEPPLRWLWWHADRIQRWEVRQTHDAWLRAHDPEYGVTRLAGVAQASRSEAEESGHARRSVVHRLAGLLAPGAVIAMPSAAGPAPLLALSREERARENRATLVLCSLAGLAGLPQLSLPLARVDGAPVGLSLVAAAGADELLLDLAARVLA